MTYSSEPLISAMGEAAFLCESPRPSNDADQLRVWGMSRIVEQWPCVRETVPGVNNLLVIFDPQTVLLPQIEAALRRAWSEAAGHAPAGRLINIPVIYGGEEGIDLPEIAAHAGLAEAEVVALHSAVEYVVYAIGAVPGFPYLAGLNPRLAKPRRNVPRVKVERGAVMLAGVQTGILPVTSPSGWHVLGRTSLPLFDPYASPPVALQPGDRVRFTVEELKA